MLTNQNPMGGDALADFLKNIQGGRYLTQSITNPSLRLPSTGQTQSLITQAPGLAGQLVRLPDGRVTSLAMLAYAPQY